MIPNDVTPEQVRRKLPGKAVVDSKGNIPFYKGRVIYESRRIQYVEMDHRLYKLIWLVGDTYIYWCPKCRCTIWEQELMLFGLQLAKTCPFCETALRSVQRGDKVRVHYRYDPNMLKWGNWWAERWD